MSIRLLMGCGLITTLLGLGCNEGTNLPSVAFGSPIDFTYACAGAAETYRPTLVGDVDDATLCDPDGATATNLFGLVLNRQPARVHVLQMTSDGSLPFGVVDADRFVPGFSGIPVDDVPLRLLRTDDWSAFYVLSSGGPSLQRLVIHGVASDGSLDYTLGSPVTLPGRPSDAVLSGDTIWVASATSHEIWTYAIDTHGGLSEPTTAPTPARVHTMQRVDDQLLVTWADRPVLTLMTASQGTVVSEVGLSTACSDTLDNDGDGLVDARDPDCRDSQDPTESGGLSARPTDFLDAVPGYPPELVPCADGIDNDGDGLTDAHDPACDSDTYGEWKPACDDGLDNDGDGQTDGDDDTCYGAHDLSEGRFGSVGPYHAAYVDGGDFGRFVYVLDTARSSVLVFALDVDGSLTAVDIPATDTDVEALEYAGYDGGEGGALLPIPRRALLGPAQQGEAGLPLGSLGGVSLDAGQLRGELWSHVVADRRVTPGTIDWTPGGCDVASDPGVCVQPDVDDATWYVFMPTLNGEMLLIEAIRRGVPLHRFAQVTREPQDRGSDITEPTLSRRGETHSLGSASLKGAPFLGPTVEEELVDEVEGVSPRLFRRYGIWPSGYPDSVDLEGVPSETWTLTYEGKIPETDSSRGRFLDGSTFYDPGANFCEAGVEAGDWLTLEVAPSNVAPEARATLLVTTSAGLNCPLHDPTVSFVDIPITGVSGAFVSVDLSEA
ncbi:MAG: hypothetical protein QF464_06545, partial [Myxococcota bacterium]|nr:hypothetical protein [Myxococcota bacterium]